MEYGLFLTPLRMAQIREVTIKAEALGFDSVWLGEHIISPVDFESPYPFQLPDVARPQHFRSGLPLFDPYAVFGHLSALTETMRFGIGVSVLPLHDPYRLARSVMTIDHLAPGRFMLGVGTGWLREEFEIVGRPFAGRGARLDEMLDVMEKLWSDEVAVYDGQSFQLPPSQFEPKPLGPTVPLVFGGHSDVALRRTAARGEGWLGVDLTPEQVEQIAGHLDELCHDYGRRTRPEISVLVGLAAGIEDQFGTAILDRLTPDVVGRYCDAGVHRLVIRPWRRGRDAASHVEIAASRLGLSSKASA